MHNEEILAIASFAVTIASLIAISVVFLLYSFVPEIRANLFFRLGFHISLSDFIFGLAALYLKNPQDLNHYLCQAFGGIREFGWLASIFWTTILTRNIYHFIKNDCSEEELSLKRAYYAFIGYFPPLLATLVPGFVFKGLYGASESECWISDPFKKNFLAVGLMLYLPLGFGLLLCTIWCLRISHKLRLFLGRRVSREFLKLLYYPLVLLLCNAGVVADGVYKEYFDSKGLVALQFYAVLVRQLQGLLNAFVFIFNRQVRRALRRRVNRTSSMDHEGGHESYAISFIRNIEELQSGDRDELVAKYFDTKRTAIMD